MGFRVWGLRGFRVLGFRVHGRGSRAQLWPKRLAFLKDLDTWRPRGLSK